MSHLFLIDRDNTINVSSSDPTSPLFHILGAESLILKPGVKEAFAILKAYGIPSILVTRQRCLVKELITRPDLDAIHQDLQSRLSYRFLEVLVEPSAFTKMILYDDVVARHPGPALTLFDDSEDERQIAALRGIKTFDGTNLYQAICAALNLTP